MHLYMYTYIDIYIEINICTYYMYSPMQCNEQNANQILVDSNPEHIQVYQ